MRREMMRGLSFLQQLHLITLTFVKKKIANPLYQWNALPIDSPPL